MLFRSSCRSAMRTGGRESLHLLDLVFGGDWTEGHKAMSGLHYKAVIFDMDGTILDTSVRTFSTEFMGKIAASDENHISAKIFRRLFYQHSEPVVVF